MNLVLDTPGQIQHWVFTSRMFQLALELNTGMKHSRGPILTIMYREGWIDKPLRGTRANKKMVLQLMVDQCKKLRGPDWAVPVTVQAALSDD